jgi:DNA-binding transcriptional ArsR family regulator
MDIARWIYADLIGLSVAMLYVLGFVVFVDDLRARFNWTEESRHWTRARVALFSKGFWAGDRCKATISASGEALAGQLTKLDAFRDRFRKSAVSYDREQRRWGESLVPRAAVGPIQLKPTQQQAVAALTADPASELTRGEYEELARVSRSQAAYDLAELVEAGLIERVGKGRATRYRLAREGGTQRHWTNDRIRDELEAFCEGREAWPSAADFKAAGRGDLYVAASRYGGIAHWVEVLGFARSAPTPTASPQPSTLRAKLKWAGAGALAALGLAAVGAAVVVSFDRHDAGRTTQAAQAQAAMADESLHPRATTSQAHIIRTSHVRHARKVRRHPAHASPAKTSSAAAGTTATSGVAGVRTFSSFTSATPSYPTPLPAPTGGSAPPPLKAP